MSAAIERFAAKARELLGADPGPTGRERVRLLLEGILLDPEVALAHLTDDQPQRTVLHHDAELGFLVLAHVFREARRTPPHDHGSTWAIYGQVSGTTFMDEWEVVEPATPQQPGLVRLVETYPLGPGQARTYNEGFIHSPWREGPAKLIRIEGGPFEREARLRYRAV